MSGRADPEKVAAAEAELKAVQGNWLKRPGVTAVDVGFKVVGGRRTDDVAVRVHVARKLPIEAIPSHDVFPEHLGAVPVDVIEATYGLEPL